jgi:argininosuccinate lyase
VTRLTVIGNVNVDLLVPAVQVPPAGHERIVDAIEMRVGGAAANAALAMAALGSPPRLIGCVGDDALGRYLLDGLAAHGLGSNVRIVADARTGVSLGFEDTGRERSFLIALGSLATMSAEEIPPDAMRAASVLLCGYFTMPRLRGAPTRELLDTARGAGATTCFDPGWDPDGWPEATGDEIRRLLPGVDVFLPNELEASSLTGHADAVGAARALQELSGGWVVVKRGPDGCVAAGPDGTEHAVEAPAVRVADTTGAGDAFDAGLMIALSEGEPFEAALAFGTRVASSVVSRPSDDRYPSRDELPAPDAR